MEEFCKFRFDALAPISPIRLSPRDPNIGLLYDRIGYVHRLQSRIDQAIPWLEKARSTNPAAAIAAEHGTEVRAMAKKVIRGVGAGRWYSRRRILQRAEQPVQFRRFKALLVALFGGAGGLMEFVDESERVG